MLNAVLLLLRLAEEAATPKSAATITVTATRTETRLADTPASVVVLSREALANTAAATIDDALRQVPGFTLFRRYGSRTANPTSQGVSLRGVGASGASRAVVLDDGVPLNDPFGGWIYWGRIPLLAIDRVEIVRGGTSDLYGSGAMGGVVQFVRRSDAAVTADLAAGSQRTANGSLYTGFGADRWRGTVAAGFLTTGGYILADRSQRGVVDRAADSQHTNLEASVARGGVFLRLSHYGERRNNGTPLQVNDTTIHQVIAGADFQSLAMRAFAGAQEYSQIFSAIANERLSERVTVEQRVPSRNAGISAQWFAAPGSRHVLLVGGEARQVSGASDEKQFATSGAVAPARVFGRQRTAAAYVEDIATLTPRFTATASLRVDTWRNFDAERNGEPLPSRSDDAWSPRATLFFRATDALTLTAAAYRAFRAPTLNELYRDFRVGNVLTQANESLGPERLSAFEMGARSGPLRVTLFSMTTTDAIANVTLTTTPSLITRRRQNLGGSRSRGAEIEAEKVVGRWRMTAGWLFADATAGEKRLPQVPRHQATAQLRWASRLTAGVQMRWSSAQFDDDLNQFPLRSVFVADLFAAVPLRPAFEATMAIENVFDARIEAGATPVITLGQPRALRVGVRYRSAAAKPPP